MEKLISKWKKSVGKFPGKFRSKEMGIVTLASACISLAEYVRVGSPWQLTTLAELSLRSRHENSMKIFTPNEWFVFVEKMKAREHNLCM